MNLELAKSQRKITVSLKLSRKQLMKTIQDKVPNLEGLIKESLSKVMNSVTQLQQNNSHGKILIT